MRARMGFVRAPMSLMNARMTFVGAPMSLADARMTFVGAPMSLADARMTFVGAPMSLGDARMTFIGAPMSLGDARMAFMRPRMSLMHVRKKLIHERMRLMHARLGFVGARLELVDALPSSMRRPLPLRADRLPRMAACFRLRSAPMVRSRARTGAIAPCLMLRPTPESERHAPIDGVDASVRGRRLAPSPIPTPASDMASLLAGMCASLESA